MTRAQAEAIRQVIRDTMEARRGSYVTSLRGLFEHGAFDGQPNAAQALAALDAQHAFDVEIGEIVSHEASPVGVIGSYRLASVALTLRVWTRLLSQNRETERVRVASECAADLELACQALAQPATLTTTADGAATGIVSGQLRGPNGTGYPEVAAGEYDWPAYVVTHEINARAIVRVATP